MTVRGLKTLVRAASRSCTRALSKTRLGTAVLEQAVESAMTRTRAVSHGGTELLFTTPNGLNRYRVETFLSKEPETIAWIDSLPQGGVLWDVGANIGLYACYAAKARRCRVVAFEPSVFNLELLARNVFLNRLTDQVTIVPLPLFEHVTEGALKLTTTAQGGALSTFAESYGFDGRELKQAFEFRTVGLSMDDAVVKLSLPQPEYIKLDVDGIEHLILRGGKEVLRRVKGVSIEVNDAFATQASECHSLLEVAGLRFLSKAHSQLIEGNSRFGDTFNQVWAR